jgi:hypothetical protein
MCIEFDGRQHFVPFSFGSDDCDETKQNNLKEVQHRDSIKNIFCEENGVELIRIPHWDIGKIDEILSTELQI